MLEHNIVNSIIYHDYLPSNLASGTSAELHKYSEDQFSKTMGRMLKKLRETMALDPELESLLNECIRSRNWIAHNFFKERFDKFEKPADRRTVIDELIYASENFDKANLALFALTILAAKKHGLPIEQLLQNVEKHVSRFE